MPLRLIIAFLATLTATPVWRDRINRIDSRSRLVPQVAASSPNYLFSLAPSNGAGMPAACSSSAVTTAGGGAVTCTRAGVRYCSKHGEFSGIVAGDLVELSANVCAVMPGGDGSGTLGIGAWNSYTNSTLRSQAIGTSPWDVDFAGSPPTVTTDYGSIADPENNHTGSRYQFPATSAAEYSIGRQLGSCPFNSHVSKGIYVIGTSGSGTIDLCTTGAVEGSGTPAAAGGFGCVPCSYNSSTWTRCTHIDFNQAGAGNSFFGNASLLNGGTARSANDVVVWQQDCVVGSSLGPPIKTLGSAVASVAEVNTASVTLTAPTITFLSTWVAPSSLASNALVHIYKDANNSTKLSIASGKVRSTFRIGGSDSTRDTTASATVSASNATGGYYNGADRAACLAGSCQTTAGALTLPTGSHTVYIGSDSAGANQADGVVKGICIDPTGCTP